jgi:hypothetical protein
MAFMSTMSEVPRLSGVSRRSLLTGRARSRVSYESIGRCAGRHRADAKSIAALDASGTAKGGRADLDIVTREGDFWQNGVS